MIYCNLHCIYIYDGHLYAVVCIRLSLVSRASPYVPLQATMHFHFTVYVRMYLVPMHIPGAFENGCSLPDNLAAQEDGCNGYTTLNLL